ncbi:hypothetical protein F511_10811 [Dorcoceras hygrometricum]|uniref:Uncharacterized protein n=1 Tax=Dorcoceras hygrometricum TaxID=472368 RepID=A0A2Z7BA67_9LAMI|nr:hypothetical protein F511_10811 [Dorcoceras hygrometricum]
MPPKRKGGASRQVMVDSRTLVSADREDVPQPSVPVRCRESQPSAFRSLASAVNRAVDFMKSLVVGQTRVRQSTGHSVNPVPSGTSSSQSSVASQYLIRQRFRPRGRQFKRSSSSSSSSGGSSGARPTTSFYGQCGGFQPLETSSLRELSLSKQPGLQPTQVDATIEERDDSLPKEVVQVVVLYLLTLGAWLQPDSQGIWIFKVGGGRSSNQLCDPQWFRDTASRGPTTIVTPKSQFRTCPSDHGKAPRKIAHDPLGITDSVCKNQSVVVSVQYGPFNTYIPIRSTTIGKSRVARDPITMHTSWRLNSDIASVTSIGYPRMKASGESSTTMHRLLHASGPHPILPPNDPNCCERPAVASDQLLVSDQQWIASDVSCGDVSLSLKRRRFVNKNQLLVLLACFLAGFVPDFSGPRCGERNRSELGARLVALSSSFQDRSSCNAFDDFEQLEEEREEATVRRLFVFWPIGSFVQVVLSSFRSELFGTLFVVIVAQKLSVCYRAVVVYLCSADEEISAVEKKCARYGISCDDISSDVITISSWQSADEEKWFESSSRKIPAGSLYIQTQERSDVVEEEIQSQATVHQQMLFGDSDSKTMSFT